MKRGTEIKFLGVVNKDLRFKYDNYSNAGCTIHPAHSFTIHLSLFRIRDVFISFKGFSVILPVYAVEVSKRNGFTCGVLQSGWKKN